MSILKSIGIFSAGGILLYPVAILLQALPLLRKQIGGILGMLDSKDYAHLFPGINNFKKTILKELISI